MSQFASPVAPESYCRGSRADESAAPDRNQKRVHPRILLLEFQAHSSLPEQRLDLIVSVHFHRPRPCRPPLARRQRFGIAITRDHQFSAIAANPFGLRGGRYLRDKNPRRLSQAMSGKCNGGSVISS